MPSQFFILADTSPPPGVSGPKISKTQSVTFKKSVTLPWGVSAATTHWPAPGLGEVWTPFPSKHAHTSDLEGSRPPFLQVCNTSQSRRDPDPHLNFFAFFATCNVLAASTLLQFCLVLLFGTIVVICANLTISPFMVFALSSVLFHFCDFYSFGLLAVAVIFAV